MERTVRIVFAAVMMIAVGLVGCTSGAEPLAAEPQTAEASQPEPVATIVGQWEAAAAYAPLTLIFNSDGGVSGVENCNSLAGRWNEAETPGEYDIAITTTTFAVCPHDAFPALTTATTARLDGRAFAFIDEEGAEVGSLEWRLGESPATETVGVWGSPPSETTTWLSFHADGEFRGRDGCADLGGRWEAEDHRIELALESPPEDCDTPDPWLSEIRSAVLSDGTLVFRDAKGAEIGTLPRS